MDYASTQCLSTIHYCYVTQMSFPFFLCQYRVNLGSVGVKDARQSRSPCISSPIQPVTERVDFAGGGSRSGFRQGMSCWPLSREGSAAPTPVSGETLPLWGAGPLRWGEFDWGTLLRSPMPAASVAVFHSSVVVEHVPAQYECRFPLDARTGTRRRRVQTLRFFSVCSCGWTYV